jgi:hypothetical protein
MQLIFLHSSPGADVDGIAGNLFIRSHKYKNSTREGDIGTCAK